MAKVVSGTSLSGRFGNNSVYSASKIPPEEAGRSIRNNEDKTIGIDRVQEKAVGKSKRTWARRSP